MSWLWLPLSDTHTLTLTRPLRTTKNYRDGAFLGPRIGDKIVMGLLVMTLYLNVGNNYSQENVMNIAAILFMMCVLPSFGAAAYVPALVLGE